MMLCSKECRSIFVKDVIFSVKNATTTSISNRTGPSLLDFWYKDEIINLIKRK